MSYWDNRKPVQRERAVNVRDIEQRAVALLDERGTRGLTIRAVASSLDVAPASLYSRVSSVDDLFDLALDAALREDQVVQQALEDASLPSLMFALYRHLVAHPWTCQVIATRAPRGPNYLRLSERMCTLLRVAGAQDPLSEAYALSNFVIGSATTASTATSERSAPVDQDIAPLYAALHRDHTPDAEAIFKSGLNALLTTTTAPSAGGTTAQDASAPNASTTGIAHGTRGDVQVPRT